MVLIDIVSKLVLSGSDGLVHALYQRIRADRGAGSTLLPGARPARSWPEIADQAVAEGVLTPREARLVRALLTWGDAPLPPAPGPPTLAAARLGEAR